MRKEHCDICENAISAEEKELRDSCLRYGKFGILLGLYDFEQGKEPPKPDKPDGMELLEALTGGTAVLQKRRPISADLCVECTTKVVGRIQDRLLKEAMKLPDAKRREQSEVEKMIEEIEKDLFMGDDEDKVGGKA